jgi:hypothetical protein
MLSPHALRTLPTAFGVSAFAVIISCAIFAGWRAMAWSILVAAIVLCLGSLAYFIAVLALYFGRGVRTSGTLIESLAAGGRNQYPVLEFAARGGRVVRFADTAARRPGNEFTPGQAIEVLYDPRNEQRAYALVKGRLYLPYATLFLFGVGALIVMRVVCGFMTQQP